MHLLRTEPGGFVDDADGIARVEQSPADWVILSAADTELASLSVAAQRLAASGASVSLRLANLLHLRQHASVDLYVDDVLQHATCVVVSLLGGEGYWPYGVERLRALAAARSQTVIFVPGDDHDDPALRACSTVADAVSERVWRYLRAGGAGNALNLLRLLKAGGDLSAELDGPRPLPPVAVYHPLEEARALERWQQAWQPERPVAAVLFYRAHLLSGNTQVFDSLCDALVAAGLNPLPMAVASLKDPVCRATVNERLVDAGAAVILNTTAFAIGTAGETWANPFDRAVPVLQVVLAGGNRAAWEASTLGLQPRDLAMHIALPEVDGRVITRAISFKGLARRCELTECDVVQYEPDVARCAWVAELAARQARLAMTPNADKRVALILANYPSREGRLGNGVGLDTPASACGLLSALKGAGYTVDTVPADGDTLMQCLQAGVTNDPVARALRPVAQSVALADYDAWFASALPEALQAAVVERWGPASAAPDLRDGAIPIAGLRLGSVFVGVQPARGYHLDLNATYHDPDLVPPHSYIAFYFWLRFGWQADAVVHVGKHGNLEWLPGKGVALSDACWPDALLGPMPNVYPFICNDPGEGAQAKRRTQAVVVDHLMPPLTRAEAYGPMRELERLVDEYFDAQVLDPRRAARLHTEILAVAKGAHLDRELKADGDDALIGELDAYLCELKEAQIRDGLHVFGEAPRGRLAVDTTVALLRLPRAGGEGEHASVLRALARDAGIDYDVLDCALGDRCDGPRPAWLDALDTSPWRSRGDTVERLERAAALLVAGDMAAPGEHSAALAPAIAAVARCLDDSATAETANTLAALAGAFVPPGPSGAPSRGRLDVLPTGRNFYSVDVRAIPTQTAWHLGWKSAGLLIERHLQDHGDYPRTLGLSVWGTATMRTGGDDIAQAFALLGVRPVWDTASHRVTDFEILPVSILDRPRIDVTLRVSGFFRDAFMNVIRLFDAAVQRVATLDESDEDNPIAARVRAESAHLTAQGVDAASARARAAARVFGSKPGSYGAGLQGLIDEGCWDERADLAEAYVNWGGYVYGQDRDGVAAHADFEHRLGQLEAVVHNQDNREHDLLDSDDYYQFQGGMSAAVATLSGREAAVYHMDHSRPESPRARTLKEEINRVVRARVLNPKWLAGARRHGYKGAFEMAATVDYLFAFDATARVVEDY
ncbi:MAG: cobaltochelatase subunit CobN, partial [Pseudomonadota bacterium]